MNKRRLVLSSHTGKIKLFHIEKNGMNYFPSDVNNLDQMTLGTLLALWSKNWNDIQEVKGVIPQSVCFTGKEDKRIYTIFIGCPKWLLLGLTTGLRC